MTYRGGAILTGAILFAFLGSSAAPAQSAFRNYRCADGTQFIAAFFNGDTRAHLQIDGKAVTLTKRLSLTGTRYKGGGVTLEITRAGLTRLRHAKQPVTACELA
ncbi:membrane-bound lysozyme inhibitor of c-type lysozyme MliC [Bradyrhizobium macuxiense]|uniref:Membrane-bound lysozyme inhibitor of c-type lysozyme MliC n=1 Tax=Bradyrhizobium macuxiense TaxID=1755647 RepID=A0A560MIA2_9BRAD|nr:MliC family protein [Bradyrhizobium macuxiense]TWC07059.1 membrane-bound lysozyme inhibitor of c-type lysozyme MliC [Bradyrhizobium macuxiense]